MRVYLDHNATTPMRPRVREVLVELLDELGGNPSSVHAAGRRARAVLDEARARVAAALGVPEEGIVFTSGGTESINTALRGALRAAGPGLGLATVASEHSAVLETARALAAEGRPLEIAPVDHRGVADIERLLAAARTAGVRLVAVAAANNEVGALADLVALGEGLRAIGEPNRPLLFTDACQALGRIPLDLAGWGIDLAAFSAHKLGGPPGVGVLYRRPGVPCEPLLTGGGQEMGLRAGTENVPAIAAAALAIELAVAEREAFASRVAGLVRELWKGLAEAIDGIELLGPPLDAPRLPNTLNVLLPKVDGRVLVTRLDLEGLEASAGSACSSGSLEPSHVLLAMGLDPERARAGLRLSLGRTSGREDVRNAVDILGRVMSSVSPTL